MESALVHDDRRAGEESDPSDPRWRWSLVYIAVLAHLVFWIVILGLFGRLFGSN